MMNTLDLIDTYQLAYEVSGDGPALVFVHDGILYAETWEPQVTAFAANYTVVSYNRRGYGASPLPEMPYSNVEDLRQLLDHLQIDRTILVGASNGGGVALDFTLAYPERVERLVLVGAAMTGFPFSPAFQQRVMAMFQPLIERRDVAASIDLWAADPYLVAGDNPHARERIRVLLNAHWNSMINPQDMIVQPPAPSAVALSTLAQPTLVLVGEHDHPDVHAHAGAIAFGLSHAERIVVPSTGHFIYLEQPEQFNDIVAAFLDRTVQP